MIRMYPMAVRSLAVVIALATCGVPVQAQELGPIDHRTGDASNQLGSGGYNPPTETFVPNTANLFITGNVTGGRSFQAFSPIRDAQSLWTSLPSSALDAFRRDSVSLDTTLRNQPPGTVTPYYSRQRTTTSLGTLEAGFEQFGDLSSQDIFTVPQSAGAFTMYRFGQAYAPELGSPSLTTAMQSGQVSLPPADSSAFLQPLSPYATLTSDLGSLFGAVPASSAYAFDRYGSQAGQPLSPVDAVAQPGAVDLLIRSTLPSRSDVQAPGQLIDPLERRDVLTGRVLRPPFEYETLPTEADVPVAPELAEAGAESAPMPGAEPDLAPEGGPSPLPLFSRHGADVYADMTNAYAFVATQQEQADGVLAVLAKRPTLAGQYEEATAAARQLMDQPLDSFAGSDDTAIQHYLRRAEEFLHEGRYYQAQALCAQAEVLDRHNPLVLLSHGHAMLAAGEYYTAAYKLSRAIELFPGIAFFKLDLTRFITEPDLLELRRADLERRLEKKEDYRFRFLLGYAEYYSGLEKYGLENLRKAAELAPEYSGMARLHHLLTMKLPDMPE
ncbi:MAG TPA: hypothetical protein VM243_19360 [Phycisphaerae bacterium]|nr:hypothetical protein [Phycisphaerae bacterium]